MNRCYRLVWNHVLQTTQVASELATSASAGSGSRAFRGVRGKRGPASHRLVRTAGQLAFTLSLSGIASSVWAATCTATDTSACSAAGGSGFPGRSGNGGAGNGMGGGSSHLGVGGVTVQDSGSPGATGVGGSGAAGDSGSSPSGGGPGASFGAGNLVIGTTASGTAGTTGPLGTNFGSGGSGGGAGLYYSGTSLTITTAGAAAGGAGGAGGDVSNTVSGNGGGGGGGGSGLMATGVGATISVQGALTGGAGGTGGNGGFGGAGGGGGDGLLSLGGAALVTNTGSITGGTGAAAGTGTAGSGTSGAGGAGVNLVGGLNVLANVGTVTGGTSNGGAAGVGVITRGSDTITNAGTISGGIAGGTRAAAIEFGGAGNVLNLLTGSTLVGDLVVDAGASATIAARNNGLSLGNAITLTDSASAVTFDASTAPLATSGVISGLGSVTTTGGTLVSSASNTYTGSTTISSGGELILIGSGSIAASAGVADNAIFDISSTTAGASIKALTGTGAVGLGSRTLTLTNAAGTFSGVIGGSGGLTLAGGTQTLGGVNTYTGATAIGSGTVLALTGSASIAASNSVTNNGTLDISGTTAGASINALTGAGAVALGTRTLTLTNASGSYGGTITGTGGLTLNGGTQTLTAAGAYTGATTINGGTLALSGSGSIAASAGVALASSGATLDVSSAAAQSVAGLSGVAGSRVVLGANTLAVTAASDSTFDGTLTGTGVFAKQGSGTLTLNGASTAFSGTTRVSGGTLEVGDASHSSAVLGGNVSVDSQGTLRGHGTVAGNVANQGIVMPGGSIGTLTVSGNYTQASNAGLTIEVSPTAGSQLQVGGSATLNGALSIVYDPGTYTARRYAVLTAANGVSGTFSSVASSASSGADLSSLKQSLVYGANEVDLQLAANAATGGNTGSGTGAVVVVAPTNTSIYTAVGTTALMRAQSVNAALLGRPAAAQNTQPSGRAAWVEATGSGTRVDGADGRPGFMAHEYGFLAGVDREVGGYTLGVAGGYSHTSIDEEATGDSGATDALRVALYGGRRIGPVRASATLGYALDFLSQKRPFGSVGTAEGDHLGHELSAAAQAALPMNFGSFVVTPSAGLRYAFFRGNGFGESGAAGQNLSVGADTARSLQPYVSLALDKAFGDTLRPVDVQLRVGYARELLGTGRAIAVTSQDGTLFAAPGDALARDYLTGGASVSFHPSKAAMVSLGFDALVNTGHASAQSGYARLDYRF